MYPEFIFVFKLVMAEATGELNFTALRVQTDFKVCTPPPSGPEIYMDLVHFRHMMEVTGEENIRQ